MSTDNGGSNENYIDTHFRADAATSITAGVAPYTGNFLPEGDLSVLNGVDADGDWILRVCDDAGADTGTLDSWEITFVPFSITNDDPAGAISLTVGANFAENAIVATNENATDSEVTDPTIPAATCGTYSGTDVWFSAVVPGDGNVTIETAADGGSPFTDSVVEAYSGPIGTLVSEGCNDDTTGLYSQIDLTGLTPGATIYIRVFSWGGTAQGTFQISAYTMPPANDDPAGAISLTVGTDFAENAVIGSNVNATASEVADPTIPDPVCANYQGTDVWFSVVVPADGNVNIETNSNASSLADSGMAVYSGPVGALVLEECDDDSSTDGLFSLISLSGRTPGETLYIRVWEFGGDIEDTFQISAWNPVLSSDDFSIEGFNYYPNPVKDILTMEAPSIISNAVVYSINGQELMRVSLSGDKNMPLDMSGLSRGVYFVKVTVDDKTDTFKVLKE